MVETAHSRILRSLPIEVLQARLGGLRHEIERGEKPCLPAAERVEAARQAMLARLAAAKPQRLAAQHLAAQKVRQRAPARLAAAGKTGRRPPIDDALRALRRRVSTFGALEARLRVLAAGSDPRIFDTALKTTFLIETAKPADAKSVFAAVAEALVPWQSQSPAGDWLHVEPLYRRRYTDRFFCVDLAVARTELLPERFRLAAHIKRKCGFASVQFERSDSLRFSCSWHRTSPAPADTEWNLRLMRVFEAWALTPPPGQSTRGAGVWIGHPDTGWNEHPEYDRDHIDRERAHNAFFDVTGEDQAKHPTTPQMGPVINNLTHGSGTGSIMISRRAKHTAVNPVPTGPGPDNPVGAGTEISGIAPEAMVIPVRCVDGVILMPDNRNVGRAIEYLMDLGDPKPAVISISLGGAPHYSLETIIREAVHENNLIVVAAAGQYALNSPDNSAVEPAAYRDVVGVAGCTDIGHPWDLSLVGPTLAAAAPATGVYCADYKDSATVQPVVVWGEGTSFSAAETAAVAALWVGFWGQQTLLDRYAPAGVPLAHVFRQLLMQTANPQRIVDTTNPLFPCSEPWPRDRYGAGIVDAHALLEAALPDPADIVAPGRQSSNIITGIPEVDEWVDGVFAGLAALGEDAVREGRELVTGLAADAQFWARAGAQLAARTARQAADAALGLWRDAEGLADAAVGAAAATARDLADELHRRWDAAEQAAEDAADAAADAIDTFASDCEQAAQDLADTAADAGDAVIGALADLFG